MVAERRDPFRRTDCFTFFPVHWIGSWKEDRKREKETCGAEATLLSGSCGGVDGFTGHLGHWRRKRNSAGNHYNIAPATYSVFSTYCPPLLLDG